MSFYELKAEQLDYFYFNHIKKEQLTPPHFHSAIELLFCVNGKQELCVGGETQTLQAGDACFIDSYVVHSLKPQGAELYVISGDLHFFQPVFSAFGEMTPTTFFRFEDYEFLSFLYALHNRKKRFEGSRVETNNAIVKLILSELVENVPFEKRKENKQNELVAGILQYAAEHFSDDLSLEKLSSLFGYSHDYLSRVLHRYLGLNWSIYVGDLRAREARALLDSQTGLSVIEIAMHCGFESLNTFYRAYRRVFGTTPLKKDNI